MTDRSTDLRPSVESLEAALAAREELIAVIGHECRNAMAPLALLATSFESIPATDELTKKKLEMLARNLKSFTHTMERISEVSQLRAGKLALEYEPVDAAEVVSEVCEELASLAKSGGCELTRVTPSVSGQWDRRRLAQIVKHLVGNAIRYAPGGPISVSISSPTTGELTFVVEDEGHGIPEEERADLFDRFDHAGPRRSGGLGVGLWVCKTLCKAMGGHIELAPAERGARFCVTLPRG